HTRRQRLPISVRKLSLICHSLNHNVCISWLQRMMLLHDGTLVVNNEQIALEFCGHETSPELRAQYRPPVGEQYRSFQRTMKRLEHDLNAEETKRRAKQKAREEEGEFYLSDAEDYFDNVNLRAKMKGTTATGLLDLPPEILTMIAESAAGHPDTLNRRRMKGLRLTHPLLSDLDFLKHKLFGTLTLTPDPDQLWLITKSAVKIAPYVKKVIFRPVLVDKSKAPKARQNDSNAWVKKVMKPRIDEAIESGRVQRAWVDFLDRMRSGVDIMVLCREDENKRLITSPGPTPQTFLQLVVASLAASRCNYAELDLQSCTQSAQVWQKIDSWKGLELGSLKSLRVALAMKDSMRRRSDSEKYLRDFDLESACVLRNLLRKSGSTLQSLTIETDTPSLIYSTSLPTLPPLRFLMLSQINNVDAGELASWIARLQMLGTLILRYVGLKNHRSTNDWLPVFRAVRDHHGGVQVTFHSDFVPGQHLMFSHQCGSRTNIKNDPPGYSCYSGVKVLKQYLSGARDWPNIPP
ncbi:hypothetical protein HII31_02829, partial [Pseudocercospora fuligena]